jgi:hypothetical protein
VVAAAVRAPAPWVTRRMSQGQEVVPQKMRPQMTWLLAVSQGGVAAAHPGGGGVVAEVQGGGPRGAQLSTLPQPLRVF